MFEYILIGVAVAINVGGLLFSIWGGKRLFKCCNHKWVVTERSNALQQDEMGNPLRLVICRCHKCGKIDQQWIDVDVSELEEVKSGKSFLLEWDWG